MLLTDTSLMIRITANNTHKECDLLISNHGKLSYKRQELQDACWIAIQELNVRRFRPRTDKAVFKKFFKRVAELVHFTENDLLLTTATGDNKVENSIYWALKDLTLQGVLSHSDDSYTLLQPYISWENHL